MQLSPVATLRVQPEWGGSPGDDVSYISTPQRGRPGIQREASKVDGTNGHQNRIQ